MTRAHIFAAILTLVCGSAALTAQTPAPPAEPLPPQIKLGARADMLRRALKVRPTVVLVSNTDDYARMIGHWTLEQRFPILIDDGTTKSHEEIARFVRAFKPETVVRWSAPSDLGKEDSLPKEPEAFRTSIDAIARLAWGARTQEELVTVWKQTQFTPFGAVVASPADHAWTGALALAAGRGQPIIWIDSKPAPLGASTTPANVDALDRAIKSGLDALGHSYQTLGDEIDSLTLCLNTQTRIADNGQWLALTDRLARNPDGRRYAWVGLLPGDARTSAYRAMCALFLMPKTAWLFDGYKEGFAPPYALPAAARLFSEAGFEVSTNVPPLGGLSHWRARALFGTSADFIHVNSSGNAPWFDLTPDRAYAGEIPMLVHPAIVNFIHSFSAQGPQDPDTVAGRWLENGAYAYYGSMDEPFLGAFLPLEVVAKRWFSGAPFVCAVRQDEPRVWKLNYFGDPLITYGPAAARHDDPLTLERATNLNDIMRDALKDKDLAAGATALILLGRDEDAVKLAAAVIASEETALTPELARAVLFAAYRRRDKDLFLKLYAALDPVQQREAITADTLWQLCRTDLATTSDVTLVNWLRATIRNPSMVHDADALAPAVKRLYGVDVVRSMYGTLLQRTQDPQMKKWLTEAAAKY